MTFINIYNISINGLFDAVILTGSWVKFPAEGRKTESIHSPYRGPCDARYMWNKMAYNPFNLLFFHSYIRTTQVKGKWI